MRLVSLDTETHITRPGLLTPPLVCGSLAEALGQGRLLTRAETLAEARRLLEDPEAMLVGANMAYDFGVLANEDPSLLKSIFKAYEEERVADILVLEALHAIAEGHLFLEPDGVTSLKSHGKRTNRYSLEVLVHLVLGRKDAKENDFWRKRYALLESVPHAEWPWEAKQYPIDDAENTLEVAMQRFGTGFQNASDLSAQCETAWALHLGACWGIRTDPERVVALKAKAKELYTEYVKHFAELGFYKPREGENPVRVEVGLLSLEPGVRAVDMDLESEESEKLTEDVEPEINPDGYRKDNAAVARAVALSYGCSGQCKSCGGAGKVRSQKQVVCRGFQPKPKARYQGCLKNSACVCAGTATVTQYGSRISCKTCYGTGLDLDSSENLPRTDKGSIKTDRDTLSESGDDNLMALADNKPTKILKTYIPVLEQGTAHPINLRPNVLVETGRTSYEGVIQQTPRSGIKGVYSVRECYVARSGRLFSSTDYSAIELCALSQCCIWIVGFSEMANIINRTKDPGSLHTEFAAKMVGCSPDEMKARVKAGDKLAKGFRQASKAANFGFPGGMGAAKFVLTYRKENAGSTESASGKKYIGLRFCILVDNARECGVEKVTEWKGRPIPPTCKQCLEVVENNLKPAWFEQWPEVRKYLDWVNEYIELTQGTISCMSPWMEINAETGRINSHRLRGNVEYCAAANNGFQALNADGAKAALRAVTREAYTDESSVLYKSRTRVPFFMHDEIFAEADEESSHLSAERISEIMVREMKKYMPDVHVVAEPCLMKHWAKDAEPVFGVEHTPRPDLVPALLAASWKTDKDDSRSENEQALAFVMRGRARFGSLSQANKFAAEVRFRGAKASDSKLVPWYPKGQEP